MRVSEWISEGGREGGSMERKYSFGGMNGSDNGMNMGVLCE